jgi:hypothetical protein
MLPTLSDVTLKLLLDLWWVIIKFWSNDYFKNYFKECESESTCSITLVKDMFYTVYRIINDVPNVKWLGIIVGQKLPKMDSLFKYNKDFF